MPVCPRCDGKKSFMAFVNRGPDIAHHSLDEIACETCLGTGVVTVERAKEIGDKIRRGAAMRKERLDKGLGLREAAAIRGISPSELSRIETGRT